MRRDAAAQVTSIGANSRPSRLPRVWTQPRYVKPGWHRTAAAALVFGAQALLAAVALEHRALDRIEVRLTDVEIQRGYDLEQVPAIARVVEVEQPDPLAINHQVFGREIGVDQPVVARAALELRQFVLHSRARALDQRTLLAGQRGWLPEASPERTLADEPFGVPRMPREWPAASSARPGCATAPRARRRSESVSSSDSASPSSAPSTLPSGRPAIHWNRSTWRGSGTSGCFATTKRSPFDAGELGHVETVREQRAHPRELRTQLGVAVITGTMHAQRTVRPSLAAIRNTSRSRYLSTFERARLEIPRRERRACELCHASLCASGASLVKPVMRSERAQHVVEGCEQQVRVPLRTASAAGSSARCRARRSGSAARRGRASR